MSNVSEHEAAIQSGEKMCMENASVRSSAKKSSADRNGSIELARWFGAIGIVLFHMHLPGQMVGYSALSFFVVLTVYFSGGRPLGRVLERLLLPWAVWSVIYGGALVAKALMTGQPWTAPFQPWMLGTGPALHLWYLIFCAVFIVLLRVLGTRIWAWALVPVMPAMLYLTNMQTDLLFWPVSQWVVVLPGACLGAMMLHRPKQSDAWIGAMALVAGAAWSLGWDSVSPQLLIMALVLLVVRRWKLPDTALLRSLGTMSLGIYLTHPLLMGIFGLGASFSGSTLSGWPLFAAVIVAAHLATLVLKQIAPRII